MQSITVSGFKSGVLKNKKPFLIPDQAFKKLENAYVFREEVRKREGLQLIGRLRRVLTSEALSSTTPVSDTLTLNTLFSELSISGEPDANIEPGTLEITIGAPDASTFSDDGDGSFTATGLGVEPGSYVNYSTGEVVLQFSGVLTGGATITVDVNYFPSLPAMGIRTLEQSEINEENTVWFDTKYAYTNNGSDFSEYLPASAVTWDGGDADFFWSTNYRGSDANTRLFFVTNFNPTAGSPMRYTDNSTWTDFQPVVSGTDTTDNLAATTSGTGAYGPVALSTLGIIEGSVVITVSHDGGTENDVIFRDTPRDGSLVSSGSNSGTINYSTGNVSLTFNPVLPGAGNWSVTATYQVESTYIFTARILIPYYGRLIALNTYEGTTVGGSSNFYNRARFSQIGSPIQQDAWRSDVFGKGGFIDAPTNEEITGATFFKNTLIVTFERTTWRLQYLGEYGTPFIWERVSSDFGSESTFSNVLFDEGVLAVGDKAIVSLNSLTAQRIDLDIPDQVYDFKNDDEGVYRVHGIRDFKKELVYWCYPESPVPNPGQYFPNKTLVYNYRNNTYAFFRNSITVLGQYQYPTGITWDQEDVFWDNYNVFWDSSLQSYFPVIASANQQGFCHYFGSPDVETQSDSTLVSNDQESMAVNDVTVGSVVTLTIPNHNLTDGECIYLSGLLYLDTSTSTPGSTTLNNKIYFVTFVDEDNISLNFYDPSLDKLISDFAVTNVGTYVGGGVCALFPVMNIETKDFNPAKQGGMNIKTSYIDFLFDTVGRSNIKINMMMNTSNGLIGNMLIGNMLIGNSSVEQGNSKSGIIIGASQDDPCQITSKNHCLLDGDRILIDDVIGMTELNGTLFTVTFIDTDTFSIGVDSSLYTTYERGGSWEQMQSQYFTLNANYGWHRFLASCYGQFFSLQLTYDTKIMSQIQTHRNNFALNAIQIYYRPGGINVFGK